ncbi:copper amine oxidase N-terminal domain-containing protein [Gorillibacterium sp. sgz5001074]|uniref:copper amine oxidase N-terminal domain-containing protein n=1 Tax=Gorillibacterium sp. sgz5001074 TaxID=3446695 RepID=UPI003F679FCA
MKQRILALLGTTVLVLSLLAGCTTVGGVDLEKVMQNAMNASSYEGSHQVSFELELGAQGEGKPDLSAIRTGKLVVSQVKQESKTKSSMAGELQYGASKVPFQAYQSGEELAVVLQGSAVPLLMGDAKNMAGGKKKEGPAAGFGFDLSSLNWQELLEKHGPSLLKYMPNPEGLTVTDEKVTVNGQALDAKVIHVSLTGEQLGQIIRKGIMNLLADTENGDKLIEQIVVGVVGDSPMKGLGVALVKQVLRELADDLSGFGPMAPYLNKSNVMKLDLYVDKDLQVRRYAYDLQLSGLKLYDGAVTGLKVKGTSDLWNIGGAIKADSVDTSKALDLSKPSSMARYIKGLDKDSAAYQLLVKELKATRKHLVLPSAKGVEPGASDTPYVDQAEEVTMVPVRFVTENLDAEVKWIEATQQVQVTDILSGKTLLFTIGSKTVLVDGKPIELERGKAVLTGDYTFVPVRIIAEQFGAEVRWDDANWVVSIIRN